MKKYYLLAIDHDSSSAMNNLGYFYKTQNKYDDMEKYYLMAIDHGCSMAAYNLGFFMNKMRTTKMLSNII